MMDKKKAAALAWTRELLAPQVLASGRNLQADRLLEIAGENGIKIVRDPVLADILCDTEIGSYIPEQTYEAIAAIFAFLDDIQDTVLF